MRVLVTFCIVAFYLAPTVLVSPKSRLFKFNFQWIWAPMTFKIPKIYVNMLAEFKCYSLCSTVLCNMSMLMLSCSFLLSFLDETFLIYDSAPGKILFVQIQQMLAPSHLPE